MKLLELKKIYHLSFEPKSSVSQFYEETDIPIKYLRIYPSIKGQNTLVLSKNAAIEVDNGNIFLKDLNAIQTENGEWGLVLPDPNDDWEVDMQGLE